MAQHLVLAIEDSDEDAEAIERAIGRSHPGVGLEFVRFAGAALGRLTDATAPAPDLVLLDLNMPGEGGLSVLTRIRARAEFDELPVVVFTSSAEPAEADTCYAAGASSYIYKPINFALFKTVLQGTLDYWLSRPAGDSSCGNATQKVVPPPSESPSQA